MMTNSLLRSRKDVLEVIGDMSIHTIPELYRQSQDLMDSSAKRTIDLAGVTHADSAGFALLLEWQSRARQSGHRLEIVNPPDTLLTIARLSGADALLGWQNIETATGATK